MNLLGQDSPAAQAAGAPGRGGRSGKPVELLISSPLVFPPLSLCIPPHWFPSIRSGRQQTSVAKIEKKKKISIDLLSFFSMAITYRAVIYIRLDV